MLEFEVATMFRIAFSLILLCLLTGLVCGSQQPEAPALYDSCCDRVNKLVNHGRFKEASLWADRAIEVKAHANPVGGIRDEVLADDLLALGKYKEAEKVLQSLPPVGLLHKKHTAAFEVYRRELLGRGYIGQGKLKEALQELRKPIVAASTDRAELDFHAGEALVLLNDKGTAKQMFAEDSRRCFVKEANLYDQLLDLADEDNERAKTIADTAISLWQNDVCDGVFELEFCEQVMLQKKCFYAARLLSNQVWWIKQR
jgi:tetratricopeptide (TPR) repeat protein